MNRTLLYIVRNNFEDGIVQNKSILGVFSSLQKAYDAGHAKYLEMHKNYPEHHMELKVVQLNMSDYLGCSAYSLDFGAEYSEEEIAKKQEQIENWSMWKVMEASAHEKEYNTLIKEYRKSNDDSFLNSEKGQRLIELVQIMIGYGYAGAIEYVKRQKYMLE